MVDPERTTDVSAESGPISGQIQDLARGILTGRINGTRTATPRDVVIAVNRRVVGTAPLKWGASDGEGGDAATFQFDVRRIAPDLFTASSLHVEIRADRTVGSSLDELTIATDTFFTTEMLDRPAKTVSLEGFVDEFADGLIRGWVWDHSQPKRRVSLYLFFNDVYAGMFEASRYRADIQGSGRGDGLCGFNIPAKEYFACHQAPVSVLVLTSEPECWVVPTGIHAKQGKQRTKRPKAASRRPHSLEEFVALLVSAEPFPKKVYAIEALGRKTPDAFAPEYTLLGLEFLKSELIKGAEIPPRNAIGFLRSWLRNRKLQRQIGRLSALAEATMGTQRVMQTSSSAFQAPSSVVQNGEGNDGAV